MRQLPAIGLVALAVAILPGVAAADTVVVTGGTGFPTASSWGFFPTENTSSYGGNTVTGTTVITGAAPRNGSGSVELTGDRTRFQLGNQYAVLGGPSNLGALGNVLGLTFDWRIAADSANPYSPDYTPALRLLVQDGSVRSELIWEGVYNGTYGNTVRDTWYSSGITDSFYQYKGGVTFQNGQQVNKSLRSWITENYSSNAYVSGISVGDGSGASPAYHAFVDDVTLTTTAGATTYNFELAATAVPEPASLALLGLGLGLAGMLAARRRAVQPR